MNLQENIQRIKQMMGLFESISDVKENLRIGSVGKNVEELQKILEIYKDGVFGLQTKQCIMDFQNDVHIEDDGIVGPITKNYIKKLEDGEITWNSPEYCKTKKYTKLVVKTPEPDDKTDGNTTKTESSEVVIFMAGLEKLRSKEFQANILQNALPNKKVITRAWTDLSGIESLIRKYPNAYVVLFSKACESSSIIVNIVDDKNKLFIVEPYSKSSKTAISVRLAVKLGVPVSNVIVAPNDSARGTGVVKGAKVNNIGDHFDALKFVAKDIK